MSRLFYTNLPGMRVSVVWVGVEDVLTGVRSGEFRQYGLNQGALECCPVVGTANSYDFADCTPPTTCMDYTSASNPSGDQTTVDGTVMWYVPCRS